MDKEIDKYDDYVNQRFVDENIDIHRPLLKPKDLFVNSNKIKETLPSAESVSNNIFGEINFSKGEDFLSKIKNNSFEEKKIVFATNIQSEYESFVKKFSPKIKHITNLYEAEEGINIINTNPVRPIRLKDKLILFHNEYHEDVNLTFDDAIQSKSAVISKETIFKEGDFVVHENYGIGKYQGLEVVTANGNSNEYIKIIYSSNESLYVPLRSVDLISKYHKSDLSNPITLDSLSSNRWLKNKEKAKKRAYDHAAEILDVESRRQESLAYSLKVNEKDFLKFNDDFAFTETPDQLLAIDSIKKDIGLIKPMNRVLCGDVGFGKTEVAMRSAFICVSSQKQVIVLTPSTVLSNQHYESFLERFKNTAVNIKLINRHTKKSNKDKIVEEFNKNKVDILIGTHALFTSGINFSDTGLLIVDEEHKFGIRQKDI
ncbi:MAG: DEAD/DEAH box helicase, partial [Proteobacteria bacterium]|nr:DEAD/DEAH box helicase [Pseudomonadota bacterium]